MIDQKAHLLIVDDDNRLRNLLVKYLKENHFFVSEASTTKEAESILNTQPIDLIVLDIMMPGETGLEFTKRLRTQLNHAKHQVPILMLTALGETEQRILGLEVGADDYLGKPFEPKELILRVQKILSRSQPKNFSQNSLLHFGSLTYDTQQHTLTQNSEVIHLTSAESDLMKIFAANPRITLSREELAEQCGVSLSPRTIDVQVTRLRKKLEEDPKKATYLRTVRHKGYALWPDN